MPIELTDDSATMRLPRPLTSVKDPRSAGAIPFETRGWLSDLDVNLRQFAEGLAIAINLLLIVWVAAHWPEVAGAVDSTLTQGGESLTRGYESAQATVSEFMQQFNALGPR